MKLGLNWRHELHGVSPAIVKELDAMISGIAGWTNEQHNEDGGHGDVTADSVDVDGDHDVSGLSGLHGGVAFSGHITPPQLTDDVNNYGPAGIGEAFLVRVSGDAQHNITGIQDGPRLVPIDGRLLFVQNVGDTDAIVLKHEDTGSRENNRFFLTDALDIALFPSQGVLLHFNPKTRRWCNLGGTYFPSLPAGDPSIPGRWYNDSGTVKVSL